MKIDPKVEEPLRHAYVAVIDENADGIAAAMAPLDVEQSKTCLGYAAFVAGYVMNDVYGEDADGEAADVMAERIVADTRRWAAVDDREEVAAFLLACATGDTEFTGVDTENVSMYSLIVGGTQLAWYSPEGMRWWEYLDQIWNHAESLPENA